MKEDICLLFMPQCMPYDPYPALPYLKGYLKERKVSVEQYDVNHDFYNYILNKETLSKSYELSKNRLNQMETKEVLLESEKLEYKELIKPVLFGNYIINSIDSAIDIMHSKVDFYDPKKYLWASNTISAALALYSCNFHPEKITVSGYQFYTRDITSINDVIDLVESDRVSIFDDYFKNTILNYLVKEKPSIIGFSMFDFSQFYSSLLLAKYIKQIEGYNPTIIFGGILMSFYKDKMKSNPKLFDYIDASMIYEGEEPLYQYIEYIKGRRSIEEVNNIIYKDMNGDIIENSICVFNINQIALPDYNGIAMERYFSPEKVVSVLSSKGCHWAKCTFCTQHLISGRGVYVERDLDKFISDIKNLVTKYETKYFWFNDTSIEPKRLEAIADRIIEENINISWRCETRFEEKLSDDIIRKVAKAGCKKIGLGMESASEDVLRKIKKGIRINTVERILKTCFQYGIAPQVYFIIGFPTETRNDVNKTLEFIETNRKYMGTFGFSELFLEEGSEMALYPQKSGVLEIQLKDELRRAYSFKSSGIDEYEAKSIVNEVVQHYAKEIGERPFWGDEVESHHLFYLDHFQDPSLQRAKIRYEDVNITKDSYIKASASISQLAFDFEKLDKDKDVISNNTIVLLVHKDYKIYKPKYDVSFILEECSNETKYIDLVESIYKKYKIEKDKIHDLVTILIKIRAIDVVAYGK